MAEPLVALVDNFVDKHKSHELAQAYLDYLWSPQLQEIIAKHHLRPCDAKVMTAYKAQFSEVKTFTVKQAFGSWAEVQRTHFADGGTFDQLVERR